MTPRRGWSAAREKVGREGRCRIEGRLVYGVTGTCGGSRTLEAAHIIGREHDKNPSIFGAPRDGTIWFVQPERVVPLCRKHHQMYDAHELDLLGYLTPEEEAQAVLDAGSLESARRRLCPSAYRKQAA